MKKSGIFLFNLANVSGIKPMYPVLLYVDLSRQIIYCSLITLMLFVICSFFIFVKCILIFFVACSIGFYGPNCTIKCPFPGYGKGCQLECRCSESLCSHVDGCNTSNKGMHTLSWTCTELGKWSTNCQRHGIFVIL